MSSDVRASIGKSASAINCNELQYEADPFIAINCTSVLPDPTPAIRNPKPPAAVSAFITQSLSQATLRAYKADIDHFRDFGGSIPSTPAQLAEYLARLSETHAPTTINRRMAAIAKAHRAGGFEDPTKDEIVRATMRGIRRMLGTAQREAKPLLKEDLFSILALMGERPKDTRDKALLLLGFAGAFRRSELVGLNVEDVEHVRQGMIVNLRRSKTDQEGRGRKIGIPFGRTCWCPVKHLEAWLEIADIETGPIFRPVDRHGNVGGHRLSGEAVSVVVKERADAVGLNPEPYSGHSLRSGLATSAVVAGVSTLAIRRTTGHASDAMLARYVRIGDLFTDNAAAAVL